MATYTYRCTTSERPAEGDACTGSRGFDVTLPIGTAPPSTDCPSCGTAAVRVYAPPRLSLAPAHLLAALDSAERSRTEPDVHIGSPPRNGGPARRSRPVPEAWHRLPRP